MDRVTYLTLFLILIAIPPLAILAGCPAQPPIVPEPPAPPPTQLTSKQAICVLASNSMSDIQIAKDCQIEPSLVSQVCSLMSEKETFEPFQCAVTAGKKTP